MIPLWSELEAKFLEQGNESLNKKNWFYWHWQHGRGYYQGFVNSSACDCSANFWLRNKQRTAKIHQKKIQNLDNNLIIYGNGTVSKTIQTLIPDKIVGYVDIADENNHPKNLKDMKYDKIIISVLGREEVIIKYLVEDLQIPRDKIITLEL